MINRIYRFLVNVIDKFIDRVINKFIDNDNDNNICEVMIITKDNVPLQYYR